VRGHRARLGGLDAFVDRVEGRHGAQDSDPEKGDRDHELGERHAAIVGDSYGHTAAFRTARTLPRTMPVPTASPSQRSHLLTIRLFMRLLSLTQCTRLV